MTTTDISAAALEDVARYADVHGQADPLDIVLITAAALDVEFMDFDQTDRALTVLLDTLDAGSPMHEAIAEVADTILEGQS